MNNIELLNPYYPNAPIRNFIDLDDKLATWYDYIGDYNHEPPAALSKLTPRALAGDFRKTSRDIFYYISWLYDNDPKSVIDYGCGDCSFKKWFPNIFGVDIEAWSFNKSDLIIPNTYKFFIDYKNTFDCGMALNSIHFGDFSKIKENIHQCMSLIKINGRFLFTVNLKANLNQDTGITSISFYEEVIKSIGYKVLLLDILNEGDGRVTFFHPAINGNLRFILEKN